MVEKGQRSLLLYIDLIECQGRGDISASGRYYSVLEFAKVDKMVKYWNLFLTIVLTMIYLQRFILDLCQRQWVVAIATQKRRFPTEV